MRKRHIVIGGIEIDVSRAVTASLWELLAIAIIWPSAQLPYTQSLREASLYNQQWVVNMESPPPANLAAIIGIVLLWAFSLGFGYALYHRDLPGGRFSRGAVFGLGLWAVSMHGEFMALAADLMPAVVHLVLWILLSIPMMVIQGAILSFLYPKKYRRPPPGIEIRETETRPWSDVARDLWKHRWPVVFATGISFICSATIFATYVLLVEPFKMVPWLYRESVVEGNYHITTLIYIGSLVLILCFLYTVFYGVVRRRSPYKGAASGLFFGVSVYAMFTLPFALVFFPVNTVPTKFVVPTLLVLPLVLYVLMGVICGRVFELAERHRKLMSPFRAKA